MVVVVRSFRLERKLSMGALAIVIILVAVLIGLFINAGFLLLGARIANIESRSFGKSLGIIVIAGIASFIISLVLSTLPIIGAIIAFVCGFIITALVMMAFCKTTFGKALAASVIAWVLGIIVCVIIAVVVGVLIGGAIALG
jgi:hypothetical protein